MASLLSAHLQLDDERFLQTLLTGNRCAGLSIARGIIGRAGITHFYEQVVMQALARMERLRSMELISPAQQRVAIAFAQTIVALLHVEFPWPVPGPRALVAHRAASRNGLPARLLGDLLALDGWETGFIDADLPLPQLVDAMDVLRPRLAACIVTESHDLPKARELMTGLKASAPSCKTLISGDAVTLGAFDPSMLGVDAITFTASQLVDEARSWKLYLDSTRSAEAERVLGDELRM